MLPFPFRSTQFNTATLSGFLLRLFVLMFKSLRSAFIQQAKTFHSFQTGLAFLP